MQDAEKNQTVKKPGAQSRKKRRALTVLVALTVAALVWGAIWWWRQMAFESTDDAFIAGHVAQVSPRVAGRVLEVLVTDNQRIKAGDVLVTLDPAPFQVKEDQAKANLREAGQRLEEAHSQLSAQQALAEQSKADVAQAQAQAANAATDLARYNRLVASGAVSKQARDNANTLARTSAAALLAAQKRSAAAQAQATLAATQIKTAEAVVAKNRAALDQASLDLAYTEVKAGVSGRVTVKSVEPGDYVQAGQTVLNLVQDDIWIVANFKETQLTRMRAGQPVTVTVDAYPDHEFTGHVDSIQAGTGAAFSLLPPQNASGNYVKVVQRVPVKIVLDALPKDSGLTLAPGMSVVPNVQVRGASDVPKGQAR